MDLLTVGDIQISSMGVKAFKVKNEVGQSVRRKWPCAAESLTWELGTECLFWK